MDRLPEEMLVRIIDNLNRKDQASISLVNKKFTRIATFMLDTDCALEASSSCEHQLQLVGRFIRTTIETPRLAAFVNHLRVGDWQIGHPDATQWAPISSKKARAIVQLMPGRIWCPALYLRDLRNALEDSSQDAMTAAALWMLPNLRSVTFSMMSRQCDKDVGRMGSSFSDFAKTLTMRLFDIATQPSSNHRLPLFQDVTYMFLDGNIDVISRPRSKGWNVALLSVFLRLPALKTFVGHGRRETLTMDQNTTESDEWLCEEDTSVVTSITLSKCKVGQETIGKIWRSCRALEYFELSRYCKGCSLEWDVVPCNYSYGGLHENLARHAESLKALHLSSKTCSGRCEGEDAPIESFKMLDKLSSPEIDRDVLFGREDSETRSLAEILPAHLKQLSIHCEPESDDPDFYRNLARALLSQRTLSAIKVLGGDIDDAEESLEDIEGIELEMVVDPKTDAYDAITIRKVLEGPQDSVVG